MLSPSRSGRLQRRAISTCSRAPRACRRTAAAISRRAQVLLRVYLRGRDGIGEQRAVVDADPRLVRLEIAGLRKRTSLVATTGRPWRNGEASEPSISVSSSGRPDALSARGSSGRRTASQNASSALASARPATAGNARRRLRAAGQRDQPGSCPASSQARSSVGGPSAGPRDRRARPAASGSCSPVGPCTAASGATAAALAVSRCSRSTPISGLTPFLQRSR
jgi:hypothetical protein